MLSREGCISMVGIDNPVPVAVGCGNHGFKTMTVVMMKKFYQHTVFPKIGPMPTQEYPIGMALLKHMFPGVAECDLEAKLMHRFSTRKFGYETTIETEDIADVTSGLDEDDAEDFAKDIQRATLEKLGAETVKAKGIKAVGSGAAASKKKRASVLYDAVLDGMSEAAAKELCPKVVGIRISKDVDLHMRWGMYYPRAEAPRWVTKMFREKGDRYALFCLPTAGVEVARIGNERSLPAQLGGGTSGIDSV